MTLLDVLRALLPASFRSGHGIPQREEDPRSDERRARQRLYPSDVAKEAWARRAIVNPHRKDT